jgi:photosystem II stability/assembly factor-like uncharacterized protein
MKKYFYKVFFAAFIISAMGFRECGEDIIYIFKTLYYLAGWSEFSITEDGRIVNEIYSIAVGEGGAIYTRAESPPASWVESQSGTTQDLSFVRKYYHPDSLVACAVGNAGTVLISYDRGITWSDHSIPALSENLYSCDFIYTNDDYMNIVVCGESGVVYRLSNLGGIYTWQQITTNTTERLNTIAVYSDFYIAAGENGIIIKTKDGGLTWQNVGVSDTTADFNRMFLGFVVYAYYHGWIVGDNGKIYMTTDYGDTWLPRESGTSENLYDITFNYALEGVVVGANGVVRYSTYLGYAWQEDTYLSGLTTRDIVSLIGVNENTASAITLNDFNGDASGSDSTYIFTVSSEPLAVDEDGNNMPSEFSLEQNYPNPFNPSTKISWQSPVGSHQTLQVYDILGNEVATLVDEYLPAGTYEAEFSADGLASGIYFYQFRVTDPETSSGQGFVETKKMLMIK